MLNRRIPQSLVIVASVGLTVGVLPLLAAAPAQATTTTAVTVMARELDNPRGITFGPDGALCVAGSGKGGTTPC